MLRNSHNINSFKDDDNDDDDGEIFLGNAGT